MNAFEVTVALAGKWFGREGRALCPVCGGSKDNPPLAITDGPKGPLIYCHKNGCSFREITLALRDIGLGAALRAKDTGANLIEIHQAARDEIERKAEQARRCWMDASPTFGTPATAYLESRGLRGPLPASLAYHPDCWHGPTAHRHPTMIGRVDGGESFAVHRTFLTTSGRKAEITPNKMSLGGIRGGAVRLATEGAGLLIVGEGIESTLSFAQLHGRPATVWACLSTSGMKALRLPPEPGHIVIAQDGDAPGREAAQCLAQRAHALGWRVQISDPGDGRDFNDLLRTRATA